MFLIAPLALAAAPAIISGIAGFFGGRQTNKVNQREAQKNRAFQAGQARDQMGFQERMRNTEWQAGVADMIAAGINPAVAYSRGGASAPGGASAGGAQAAPAVDAIGSGVSSAMAMSAQQKGLKLMDQQILKTAEEAKAARFTARQQGIKADFDTARYQYYFDDNGTSKQPLLDLLESEWITTKANSARSVSDAQMSQFSVPEQQAIAKLFESVGGAGKGIQTIMPLLTTLLNRRR